MAGAMSAPIRRPDAPMIGIIPTAASPVPLRHPALDRPTEHQRR